MLPVEIAGCGGISPRKNLFDLVLPRTAALFTAAVAMASAGRPALAAQPPRGSDALVPFRCRGSVWRAAHVAPGRRLAYATVFPPRREENETPCGVSVRVTGIGETCGREGFLPLRVATASFFPYLKRSDVTRLLVEGAR